MSSPSLFSRRDVIKCGALSALAVPFASLVNVSSAAEAGPTSTSAKPSDRTHGIKLGVASISLKDLPLAGAAGVLKQLGIPCVSIYRTHGPFEKGTPEECRAAAEAFRSAGVEPVTTSVVNLTTDEAAMRRAFDNVRAAKMGMMTCKPTPESLPLVERFAKEYDLQIAIHNHGPEDKLYPSPYEVWKLIGSLDARIGLCLDVGHSMRARVDPSEALRRCASRLHDVHLKDSLAVPGAEADIPIEVGRGQLDIRGILATLVELKYSGPVAFEYERPAVNPLIGLAESVGFVRGMLAAM